MKKNSTVRGHHLQKRTVCVLYSVRVCAGSIVDRVVEKTHNASAAIKNNDDSKNDGALYSISIQLMYLYKSVLVIAGRNAGGVIYTTMKNVQECVAGTADVCIRSRSISYLAFPIISLYSSDIYIYICFMRVRARARVCIY